MGMKLKIQTNRNHQFSPSFKAKPIQTTAPEFWEKGKFIQFKGMMTVRHTEMHSCPDLFNVCTPYCNLSYAHCRTPIYNSSYWLWYSTYGA